LLLALVEDRTQAIRIDEIRRDFVANVSHELKTPVGALSLLAEAVLDASDDPEAVRRFAGRMQQESGRLTRLVQEIIDLSRLQYDDPVESPEPVKVDEIVVSALDRSRVDAENRHIRLASGGQPGLQVLGNESQLVVALGNLVENAVAYSEPHTQVAVGVRTAGQLVEITVTDQGVGIDESDLDRIFERFYRVDPARSRATGGTGLGLSIVKHVAASHGGDVAVWSSRGAGSTFTLRLPLHAESPDTPTPEATS
jgi:two-component system sensor histidine kinase SenX3